MDTKTKRLKWIRFGIEIGVEGARRRVIVHFGTRTWSFGAKG